MAIWWGGTEEHLSLGLHWTGQPPTSGREGLSVEFPISLDFVLPRVPHQDHWLPEDRLFYSFSSLVLVL